MEILTISIYDLTKMFWLALLAFIIAIAWTPILTNFLYKNNLGKRIRNSKDTPIFSKLHEKKNGTPTMGGVLIWVTAAILTLIFNLERAATWLPLFCLVSVGLIGIVDDLWNVRGKGPNGGGMRFRQKFILYTAIASAGAWWFYSKLGWNSIHLPGLGDYVIGLWYVPLFIIGLVWMAFSSNETDGLDGLAGGIFALSFGTYAIIALLQGKSELAAFCATIMGGLLAFLWFNIPPARFFMGDTGSMSLGMTLGVVAFLTNTIAILPLITLVFFVEGMSFIVQFASKKIRGKKIFLSSPIHHHFEAIGWPEYKITMRFWIIGAIGAVAGLILAIIGSG